MSKKSKSLIGKCAWCFTDSITENGLDMEWFKDQTVAQSEASMRKEIKDEPDMAGEDDYNEVIIIKIMKVFKINKGLTIEEVK